MRRFLPILALALAQTGCVPTVWLPDSSGFVYVKPTKGKTPADPPSGQLVHFDVQKKTNRVIVEDIGTGTNWPALSPDGKRIAVANFKGNPKVAQTVQITLYDLQGKKLHQTKDLPWAPARPKSSGPTQGLLFWSPSPKDDMIVVTDVSETGIYNVKADKLKVLEKAVPVIHGGSPFRPDGKGFLLLTGEKKEMHLSFVDWTGAEQRIDVTPLTSLLSPDKKQLMDMEPVAALFITSMLLPSWWDQNQAWAGFKREKITYSIDTVKKTIAVSDSFAALTKAKKGLEDQEPGRFDFAGDITVRVTQFNVTDPKSKFKMTYNKVTAVNNQTKKETTLLDKAPAQAMFLPSPDGRYLSLCLSSLFGAEDDIVLVINSKGELVTQLDFTVPFQQVK
jgi:hypothetical protein